MFSPQGQSINSKICSFITCCHYQYTCSWIWNSLLSASPRGAVWHVSAGSEGISLLLCRLQLLGQLWAVLDRFSLLHHLNGGVVCDIYVLKVWGSSSQKPIWPSPITQPWPAALPYCVAAPSRFSSFSLTVFFGRVIGKGEHGLKHSTIPSVVCDSWVKMKAAANVAIRLPIGAPGPTLLRSASRLHLLFLPYQGLPGPTRAYQGLPGLTRAIPGPTRAYQGHTRAYQGHTRAYQGVRAIHNAQVYFHLMRRRVRRGNKNCWNVTCLGQ